MTRHTTASTTGRHVILGENTAVRGASVALRPQGSFRNTGPAESYLARPQRCYAWQTRTLASTPFTVLITAGVTVLTSA
jgi:hypothetical protein